MTRFAARFSCLCCLLIVACGMGTGRALATTTDASPPLRHGTVHATDVNIRAGSSLNHEILGKVQPTEVVAIRDDEGDWYRIALPVVATCYIHTSFVSVHPQQQEQGTVTANHVNLRARPTTSSSVLGQVHEGERVTIRQRVDAEWLAIAPPPGASGWIHKQFITLIPEEAVPESSSSVEQPATASSETETVHPTTAPPIGEAPTTAAAAEIAQEQPSESMVGTIEDLGRLVARPARHKLLQDRRVVAFLVSERYNLNRFLHRPVRVWGTALSPADRRIPLLRVDRIEPAAQPL